MRRVSLRGVTDSEVQALWFLEMYNRAHAAAAATGKW